MAIQDYEFTEADIEAINSVSDNDSRRQLVRGLMRKAYRTGTAAGLGESIEILKGN